MLAGSRFSSTYARIYVYSFLESLQYNFPIVLGVHVDDLATQFHGELEEIVSTVRAAAVFIRDSFLARKLKISKKTTIVASKPNIANKIREDLGRIGIPCQSALAARDLGMDSAAGSRRSTKVMKGRLHEIVRRMG